MDVSNGYSTAWSWHTNIMPILCEESCACPEVDATTYDIQRAELWAIWLARSGIAKTLSIVAVIRIRFRLPARYPAEYNLGSGESDANHSAQKLSACSPSIGKVVHTRLCLLIRP
jgi:hypothetical protein